MTYNYNQDLYDDARIYDILFGETPSQQEIDFYSALIDQYGEPVLELACGTGRITTVLAQGGFNRFTPFEEKPAYQNVLCRPK